MGTRCTICADKAKLDIVTNALVTGSTPADILRTHPAIAASSSLYRHCRNHRANLLVPTYLDGDTTSGEVLADLAGLRRGLLEQYRHQRERGDAAASTRSAHEAHAISATLLKAGVSDDEVLHAADTLRRVMRAIRSAARNDPATASVLADEARAIKDPDLGEAFDGLAQASAATTTNRN
jgi:hypothetical protein